MGLTLNGPFREVVGLGSWNNITVVLNGQSFGTQINQLIRGSGQSVMVVGERFYCIRIQL